MYIDGTITGIDGKNQNRCTQMDRLILIQMDIDECGWMQIDIDGNRWIQMDIHGKMETYGYRCIWCRWIYMDIDG